MFYNNVLLFKIGDLYNYFNNQGMKVLPFNYKWIYQNGTIAINLKDEVVLFNKNKEEFIYYKPNDK
ncbi:MAG: repeat-containing protein [Mucilaginibacter sp.]|nr:repeat-containing protein [Mucilaginibacter sp.]